LENNANSLFSLVIVGLSFYTIEEEFKKKNSPHGAVEEGNLYFSGTVLSCLPHVFPLEYVSKKVFMALSTSFSAPSQTGFVFDSSASCHYS
jgi:hypothetical protein